MKISRLHLKLYRPLYLSNIKDFDYRPESILQTIIGTNGSGKTSLLRALSPLPGDSQEYDDGGLKHIWIEHNNNLFELISSIGKKGYHSFIKNGVELNDGGTITVQRQLVEREFDYTVQTHKLLTGNMGFADMSPNARKELLLEITDFGLEYALGVFDKLRTKHRDTTGALKHVAIKIDELTSRRLKDDRIVELMEEVKFLSSEITKMMPMSNPSLIPTDYAEVLAIEKKIDGLLNDADKAFKKLSHSLGSYGSFDVALKANDSYSHRLTEIKTKQESINSQLSFYEDTVKRLQEAGGDVNVQTVDDKINKLKNKLDGVTRPIPLSDDPSPQTLDACNNIYNSLSAIGDTSNVEVFDRDFIETFTGTYEAKLNALQTLRLRVLKGEDTVANLKALSDRNIDCPKCSHTILPEGGKSTKHIEELEEKLNALRDESEALDSETQELRVTMEAIRLYKKTFNDIHILTQLFPSTINVWKSVHSINDTIKNPYDTMAAFSNEITAIKDLLEYCDVENEMDELVQLKMLLEASEKSGTLDKVRELETELHSLINETVITETEKRDLTKNLKHYSEWINIKLKIDVEAARLEKLFIKWANDAGTDWVNCEIRRLQNRLAEHNAVISGYESIKNTISEMELDLATLNDQKYMLNILLKSISPKEGFIGAAMKSVLETFLGSVNEVINSVWEYNIEMDIAGDWQNLDYKFKFTAAGNTTKEISLASEGQKDIINFAVSLVIMKSLHLEDYPLYLDEPTSAFDKQHAKNLFKYITKLINHGECSQMFMVSHFYVEYISMTLAQTVVMNADNIVTPEKYNEHVTIS